MGRPLPATLSPSKISAFTDCPLAFRFSVIDRLPEPPSPAASKGTLVHRALELLMLRKPDERTLDAALADLATARSELEGTPEFAGLDLTEEGWSAFHAEATQLVANYFLCEDPATVRPVGLEVMMSVEIDSVVVRGVIDRLELDEDGEFVVTDYKTGRAPATGYEQSRLSAVEFYALLCEEVLGRRPARVQLLYLAGPEAVVATPRPSTIRAARQRTAAVWQAIRRACARDDFRPRPGALCDFCAFRPYCPAWGGDPEQAVELGTGARPALLPPPAGP